MTLFHFSENRCRVVKTTRLFPGPATSQWYLRTTAMPLVSKKSFYAHRAIIPVTSLYDLALNQLNLPLKGEYLASSLSFLKAGGFFGVKDRHPGRPTIVSLFYRIPVTSVLFWTGSKKSLRRYVKEN